MSTNWRRLPHQYVAGKPLFLTWHLHGSLLSSRLPPPSANLTGRQFVLIDRRLDEARYGPRFLADQRVARIVVDAIERGGGALGHYELHAYVAMANHVHLLVTLKIHPSKFMQSLKGFTARMANRILRREGEVFWQKESYDHWIRDAREFERVKSYIEWNPAKAGIVKLPEEYPWSSAGMVRAAKMEDSVASGHASRGDATRHA